MATRGSVEAYPFIPKTVNGLPFHPLMVHAVVVLVPLAVIGTIGIALWPAMRRHFALAVLVIGIIGGLSVPVAMASGSDFRARLGAAQLVRTHQAFAHKLLYWTFAFVVVLIVMVVLDLARRLGPVQASLGAAPAQALQTTRFERGVGRIIPAGLRDQVQFLRRAQPVLSVLSVVLAVVVAYYCYKTGDSGAKAVWQGR